MDLFREVEFFKLRERGGNQSLGRGFVITSKEENGVFDITLKLSFWRGELKKLKDGTPETQRADSSIVVKTIHKSDLLLLNYLDDCAKLLNSRTCHTVLVVVKPEPPPTRTEQLTRFILRDQNHIANIPDIRDSLVHLMRESFVPAVGKVYIFPEKVCDSIQNERDANAVLCIREINVKETLTSTLEEIKRSSYDRARWKLLFKRFGRVLIHHPDVVGQYVGSLCTCDHFPWALEALLYTEGQHTAFIDTVLRRHFDSGRWGPSLKDCINFFENEYKIRGVPTPTGFRLIPYLYCIDEPERCSWRRKAQLFFLMWYINCNQNEIYFTTAMREMIREVGEDHWDEEMQSLQLDRFRSELWWLQYLLQSAMTETDSQMVPVWCRLLQLTDAAAWKPEAQRRGRNHLFTQLQDYVRSSFNASWVRINFSAFPMLESVVFPTVQMYAQRLPLDQFQEWMKHTEMSRETRKALMNAKFRKMCQCPLPTGNPLFEIELNFMEWHCTQTYVDFSIYIRDEVHAQFTRRGSRRTSSQPGFLTQCVTHCAHAFILSLSNKAIWQLVTAAGNSLGTLMRSILDCLGRMPDNEEPTPAVSAWLAKVCDPLAAQSKVSDSIKAWGLSNASNVAEVHGRTRYQQVFLQLYFERVYRQIDREVGLTTAFNDVAQLRRLLEHPSLRDGTLLTSVLCRYVQGTISVAEPPAEAVSLNHQPIISFVELFGEQDRWRDGIDLLTRYKAPVPTKVALENALRKWNKIRAEMSFLNQLFLYVPFMKESMRVHHVLSENGSTDSSEWAQNKTLNDVEEFHSVISKVKEKLTMGQINLIEHVETPSPLFRFVASKVSPQAHERSMEDAIHEMRSFLYRTEESLREMVQQIEDERITLRDGLCLVNAVEGTDLEMQFRSLNTSLLCESPFSDRQVQHICARMTQLSQWDTVVKLAHDLLFKPSGSSSSMCVLQQYGFSFCMSEESMDEKLHQIQRRLRPQPDVEDMTLARLKEAAGLVLDCCAPFLGDEAVSLLRVLSTFFSFRDVWDFLEKSDAEYISTDEDGTVSALFNNTFDEAMVSLEHDRPERRETLQNFIGAASFVAALVKSKRCATFNEFCRSLHRISSFRTKIETSHDPDAITQWLEDANSAVPSVRQMLQMYLDPWEALNATCKELTEGCTFLFDLFGMTVNVVYGTDVVKVQNDEGVKQLEQFLVFIDTDKEEDYLIPTDGAVQLDVLKQLFMQHSNYLEGLQGLHLAGEPRFLSKYLRVTFGENSSYLRAYLAHQPHQYVEVEPSLLDHLQESLRTWKENVHAAFKDHKAAWLLGVQASLQLMNYIREGRCWSAACMLSQFLDCDASATCETLKVMNRTSRTERTSPRIPWTTALAELLQRLGFHTAFDEKKMDQSDEQAKLRSLDIRPQEYLWCYSSQELYHMMAMLYGDRRPFGFEVLWGDASTRQESLEQFLEKANVYPQFRFMLVHYELLSDCNQYYLMQHLSSRSRPNVFLLGLKEKASRSQPEPQKWKFTPVSCSVRCFTGPAGCGKTYQLYKQVERGVVCTVMVTESFSLGDAVQALESAVQACDGATALTVVVRCSLGGFVKGEKKQWGNLFQLFNSFLYALVCMRVVEDSFSGRTVGIPESVPMKVLVELPPSDFMGRKTDIRTYFPLFSEAEQRDQVELVSCDQFSFDYDFDELEMVGKWLWSYDTGCIDDHCGCKGRDILFLLDNSESMQMDRITEEALRQLDAGSRRTDDRLGVRRIDTRLGQSCIGLSACVRMHCTTEDKVLAMCYDESCKPLGQWRDFVPFDGTATQQQTWAKYLNALNGEGVNTFLWDVILEGAQRVLERLESGRRPVLVVLSDGDAKEKASGSKATCREFLLKKAKRLHLIFIAVNMSPEDEREVREVCCEGLPQNYIVPADSVDAIAAAFASAGEEMSVTTNLELQSSRVSQEKRRVCVESHMKAAEISSCLTHIQKRHWLQYMLRFCRVLESSRQFNRNKELEGYGSVTMSRMLAGARHAVSEIHISWVQQRHEQLILRQSYITDEANNRTTENYTWSVLALKPEFLVDDQDDTEKLQAVGITVPTAEDFEQYPQLLESYLAAALSVEIEGGAERQSTRGTLFDFPIGTLPALSLADDQFILSKDFLMKMLLMNDCIECNKPCIIQGETGVSKTKLTEMLFAVKNAPIFVADGLTEDTLLDELLKQKEIRMKWRCVCARLGLPTTDEEDPDDGDLRTDSMDLLQRRVGEYLNQQPVPSDAVQRLKKHLLEILRRDPSLDPPLSADELLQLQHPDHMMRLLAWMCEFQARTREVERKSWDFHPVNVHAALRRQELLGIIRKVAERVERIKALGEARGLNFYRHAHAKVCIFFDEFNTASCFGVLKEVIQDRRLDGKKLHKDLVPIAACNPCRNRLTGGGDSAQLREQDSEWMAGYYIARPLPVVLNGMVWDYGALREDQEMEFIFKKLQREHLQFSAMDTKHGFHLETLRSMVHFCQCRIRSLAVESEKEMWKVTNSYTGEGISAEGVEECVKRGSAAVSIRDILRFFRLFGYLIAMSQRWRDTLFGSEANSLREKALLALALVYLARLDAHKRETLDKDFAVAHKFGLTKPLERCAANFYGILLRKTGVVDTDGIKENLLAVLLHLEAKIPLIIKGPPGTSKTLAVNMIAENARGNDSHKEVFKEMNTYLPTNYQCSKQTTSTEIEKGLRRTQEMTALYYRQGTPREYFFFMDEAGIPEEEKESLKVLHYYLEHNKNRETQIGFVALTNHVLDAAKSNRCNVVTRMQYNTRQLNQLAIGCYAPDADSTVNPITQVMWTQGQDELPLREVMKAFCARFEELTSFNSLRNSANARVRASEFVGSRGFIHFWKFLGRVAGNASSTAPRQRQRRVLDPDLFIDGMRRNFNGVTRSQLWEITKFLFSDFRGFNESAVPRENRLMTWYESLASRSTREEPISRYHLITHGTTDNAIQFEMMSIVEGMQRNLEGTTEVNHVELSPFSSGVEQEQSRAMAQVKWAAGRGNLICLSNGEAVHEGLYDFLNQFFTVTVFKGNQLLKTRLSQGPNSVPCTVKPSTWVIIFTPEWELEALPSPFLDRLEKYRVDMCDVLHWYLQQRDEKEKENQGGTMWPQLRRLVFPLLVKFKKFLKEIGEDAFYGIKTSQSLESAILALLRRWDSTNSEELLFSIDLYRSEVAPLIDTDIPASPLLLEWLRSREASEVATAVLLHTAHREILHMLLCQAIPERILPLLGSDDLERYLRNDRNFYFDLMQLPCDEGLELIITRSVDRRLLCAEVGVYRIIHVGRLSRRTQLNDELKRWWNDVRWGIIVLVDVSRRGVEMLNFVRREVEAHCQEHGQRAVTVVGVVSAVDTLTYHAYDTCFSQRWQRRFLDAVGGDNPLPWLRLGYAHQYETENCSTGVINGEEVYHRLLKDCLKSCANQLAGAVKVAPFGDPSVELILTLTQITAALQKKGLDDQHPDRTVEDLLLHSFKREDQQDASSHSTKNLSGTIRDIVAHHSSYPQSASLFETLQAHLIEELQGVLLLGLRCLVPLCYLFPSDTNNRSVQLEQRENIRSHWAFQLVQSILCDPVPTLLPERLMASECIPLDVSGRELETTPCFSLVYDMWSNVALTIVEDEYGFDNWVHLVKAVAERRNDSTAEWQRLGEKVSQHFMSSTSEDLLSHYTASLLRMEGYRDHFSRRYVKQRLDDMLRQNVRERHERNIGVLHVVFLANKQRLEAELKKCRVMEFNIDGSEMARSLEKLSDTKLAEELNRQLTNTNMTDKVARTKWARKVLLLQLHTTAAPRDTLTAAWWLYDFANAVHADDFERRSLGDQVFRYVEEVRRSSPLTIKAKTIELFSYRTTIDSARVASRLHLNGWTDWDTICELKNEVYFPVLVETCMEMELFPLNCESFCSPERFVQGLPLCEWLQRGLEKVEPMNAGNPYLPDWLLPSEAGTQGTGSVDRGVFEVLWKWLLVWYGKDTGTTLEKVIAALENFTDATQGTVLNKILFAVHQTLTIRFIAEGIHRGGLDMGVKKCTLGFFNSERLYFWSRILSFELRRLGASDEQIGSEIQRHEEDAVLKSLLETARADVKLQLRLPPQLLTEPKSVMQIAKDENALADVVEAVELQSRMWVPEYLWRIYQEVQGYVQINREFDKEIHLSPESANRWEFARYGLEELSRICHLDILPLNSKVYGSDVLLTPWSAVQESAASRDFPSVMEKIMKAYHERVVLKFLNGDGIQEAERLSDLHIDPRFLQEATSHCTNAEEMVKGKGKRLQMIGNVAMALRPLMCLQHLRSDGDREKLLQTVRRDLVSLVRLYGVRIPTKLWRMEKRMAPINTEHRGSLPDEELKLHYLLHSMNHAGLKKLEHLVRRAQSFHSAVEEDQLSCRTLRCVVGEWLKYYSTAPDVWITDLLGLEQSVAESLLNYPVSRLGAVLRFTQEQLSTKAFLFCDKPYELKRTALAPHQEEEIQKLFRENASRLPGLSRLLIQHETLVQRNAVRTEDGVNHSLFKVLSGAFRSRENLTRQHPLVEKLDRLFDPAQNQPTPLTTDQYVALRLELHLAMQKQFETVKHRTQSWDLNTVEQDPRVVQYWDTVLLGSEAEDVDVDCASLVRGPSGATHAKKRLLTKRELFLLRGNLGRCLDAFDGSAAAVQHMQELIGRFPHQRTEPAVQRATEKLNEHHSQVENASLALERLFSPDKVNTTALEQQLRFLQKAGETTGNYSKAVQQLNTLRRPLPLAVPQPLSLHTTMGAALAKEWVSKGHMADE